MKFMLIMRSTQAAVDAAADVPFEQVIDAMGRYNESMIEAGVLLAGDGLSDASKGAVVDFSTTPPTVTEGAYGPLESLFNGFWMISADSQAEALEWAARAPLTAGNRLEVRRVTDETDFADFADNEFIQKEAGWREQEAAQRGEPGGA